MTRTSIGSMTGTQWTGTGELWLDPAGNDATAYACTLSVKEDAVHYTWTHDGDEQRGILSLGPDTAQWVDTWHSPEPVDCQRHYGGWALVDLWSTYSAGEGPDWGWRTILAQRPSGELVLQMTNCTPWGEEGRAVRMVFTRQP